MSSRGRSQQNRFLVFGEREICRGLEAGFEYESLLIRQTQAERFQPLLRDFPGLEPVIVADELFERIRYGERDEDLVAIGARPDTGLGQLELNENALVFVLESLEKPGNVGAIVRTADAIGASAVVLSEPLSDFFHANCIRASMGCVFTTPLATGTNPEVQEWLWQSDFAVFAAIVEGSTRYDEVAYSERSALVLGNEARGLSESWRLLASDPERKIKGIHLPMLGRADSLNVSTTAAIIGYEAGRQRGFQRNSDP